MTDVVKSIIKTLWYQLRILWAYKDLLRNVMPPIRNWYVKRFAESQRQAAQRLRDRDVINVAFQLTAPSIWKNDYLYQAMERSDRYHPYIVIMPSTFFRHDDRASVEATIDATECFVKEKGYEYVLPYDRQSHRWKDFCQSHKPDIMVFSVPYKDTFPKYYIYNFRDTFTCLIPYAFISFDIRKLQYGLIFHSLVGLHVVETEIHKQMAAKVAYNKAINCVVTGYPGIEVFLRKDYLPKMQWKQQETLKKRVIWAPHHTIESVAGYSTFLRYCDSMLDLARRYSDRVQFVFKPHQVLKLKLHKLWGVERTEQYYSRWKSLSNGQLEEGSYVDLFLASDAIIHDSGSFTTEYLYVGKPCMFLVSDGDMEAKFNEFGKQAYAQYYKGHSLEEIEKFLLHVVLEGNDPMFVQRENFLKTVLTPNRMPSELIIEAIERKINA